MIGRRWVTLLAFLAVVATAATAHAAGHAHHHSTAAPTATAVAQPVAPSQVAPAVERHADPRPVAATRADPATGHDRAGCIATAPETAAPCAHGHDRLCDCTAVCAAALLPPAVAPRGIAGRPPIGPAAEADARPHTRAPPLPPPRA